MQNEPVIEDEALDLPAEPAEGEEDLTDWKEVAKKQNEKAIAQRERTKALKKTLKEKDEAIAALAGTKKPESSKTDGLDETALDFLDVKGFTEPEDIKIIEDIVKKTGMTVRQALKDDYVVKKLEANKTTRDNQAATPTASKRSSQSQGTDLESAIAKYEASGRNGSSLPTDFALRSKVIDAIAKKDNPNKPSWE